MKSNVNKFMKISVGAKRDYHFDPCSREAYLHINGHHLVERTAIPLRLLKALIRTKNDVLQKLREM